TTNLLKVYAGAFAARGRLIAYLSDLSAPVISDFAVDNPGNGPSTVYALQYAAMAPGRFIHVLYISDSLYDTEFGNVTLQAAALNTGNRPPFVTITNPSPEATFLVPAMVAVNADASDSDGTVTNVEFFRDGIKFAQTNAPPYLALWSNAPPGRHILT